MDDFKSQQKVQKTVLTAIEASIYETPTDWGLTPDEVVEAGRATGLEEGEIRDALHYVLQAGHVEHSGAGQRLRLASQAVHLLDMMDFFVERDSDRREIRAFQFIYDFFAERARKLGRARALATRTELIGQGAAAGLKGKDVEVAVEVLLLGGVLVQQANSVLGFAGSYASPKTQREHHRPAIRRSEELPGVHAAVRDILARRRDGRPSAAEPMVAFTEVVARLGHTRFVTWWEHLREELSLADIHQPTTTIVTCAALAEGALALVAVRAREKGLWTSLPDGPRNWKLDALLKAAQSGVPPTLKDAEGARGRMLNQSRQRIHAGRLLEDPTLTVDWKPDEAREARTTLDMLLRRIIDWPPLPSLFVK